MSGEIDLVDEVTPEDFGSATDIGTRGLKVTFSNTGNEDCSAVDRTCCEIGTRFWCLC